MAFLRVLTNITILFTFFEIQWKIVLKPEVELGFFTVYTEMNLKDSIWNYITKGANTGNHFVFFRNAFEMQQRVVLKSEVTLHLLFYVYSSWILYIYKRPH